MVAWRRPRFGVVAVTAAAMAALVGWASVSSAECPAIEYVRVCERAARIGWTYDEGEDVDFGGYRVWVCDDADDCTGVDDVALAHEFVVGDNNPQSATYWPFAAYADGVVRTVTFADEIVMVDPPDSTFVIETGVPFRVLVTAFAQGEQGIDEACLDLEYISRKVYTGPEIVYMRVGDRTAALGWTMGVAEEQIKNNSGARVFKGYRIWMREIWKGDALSLVREYDIAKTFPAYNFWPFRAYYLEPVRSDSGDIFQNAFPYQFAVTMYTKDDPESSDVFCKKGNLSEVLYPNVGVQTDLASIQVIPNPYRSGADWERGGERRVTFIGLPARSTIRIYTVAADHVITLDPRDQRDDQRDWDLRNEDGDEVAPGAYLWQVEAPAGTKYGRMMIIK